MDPKDEKTSFFRLEKDSSASSGNTSSSPDQQASQNPVQQQQQYQQQQQQYQQQQQQYQQQQQQQRQQYQLYQQQQQYLQQQQQQYLQQQYQQQQQQQQQYQQQQYQQQQQRYLQQRAPHQSSKKELNPEELETRKRMALIFKSVVISFVIFGLLIGITVFSTTYLKDFKFSKKPPSEEVVQEKPKKKITKQVKKKESTKEYPDMYEMDNAKITGVKKSLLPDNVRFTINDNVRSGKIDTKEQLKYLRDSHKITRVINLALDSTYKQSCPERDKNPKVMCEKIWARQLGLDYIYKPLTNKGPKDEDWEEIKEYLMEGNTLVHCTHGADRTGAVVGRLYFEETNVDREEILEKSLKYGFKAKDYAYPGGKPDPNKHLREWMFDEYD